MSLDEQNTTVKTESPTTDHNSINDQHQLKAVNHSAFNFMMNIYKENKYQPRKYSNCYSANRDISLIENSDIIRSSLIYRSARTRKIGNQIGEIEINCTDLHHKSMMSTFELKIYKEFGTIKNKKSFVIFLFYEKLLNNNSNYDIIDSKIVNSDYQGWLTFNITETINESIKNNQERGYYIIATPRLNDNLYSLGVIHSDEFKETQPFLVGYYKYFDSKIKFNNVISASHKNKRDAKMTEGIKTKLRKLAPKNEMYSSFCSIKSYEIDLSDWSDSVIAPKTLDMHHCSGGCDIADILSHNNSNIHVAWQAMLSANRGSPLSAPRCVATDFRHFDMLYFGANEDVIYEAIPGTIATKCGCR